MDDEDYETIVAERLDAMKSENRDGVIADAADVPHKPEGHVQTSPAVIGKIDIANVKKKTKKPEKEAVIKTKKQTYAERIVEIEAAYA